MEPGIAQFLTFVDCGSVAGSDVQTSKTLSPTALQVMGEYYVESGAVKDQQLTTQYVDLRASVDASLPADPCAVLVLHNFIDTVLGPGSTDAIEAELQRIADQDLMWEVCSGKSPDRRARRCQHSMADYEDEVHCVVPFERSPVCSKLRSVLCCWAGQDLPLVADSDRLYSPRDKLNSMWSGRPTAKMYIGACFGAHASAVPLRFHAYHNSNPVGHETALYMNRGDVYFLSHHAIGNGGAASSSSADTNVTWKHVHSSKAPSLPVTYTESAEEKRDRERVAAAIRSGSKIVRQRCSFLR